jgi:hypothetical protein
MPRPTPLPLRRVVLQRAQQGQSAALIARALGLVARTVRHLLQRLRAGGEAALAPSYHGPAAPAAPGGPDLSAAALGLRRQHPTWGAGLIRVFLRRDHPQQRPPAERTLQRWFARAGLAAAPSGRRAGRPPRRAQGPHEVWQMDAADQVALRDGTQVCWLRIVDECSGAVLETAVFPPRLLEHGAGP